MLYPDSDSRLKTLDSRLKKQRFYHKRKLLRCQPARFRGKIIIMSNKKFIDDREQLEKLAPVTKAPIKHHVFVCNGKSCSAVGSAEVKEAFARELEARNLRQGKESKGRNPLGPVVLTDCSSVGFCSIGPAVLIYPEGVWYAQVTADDVAEIVEEHLVKGIVIERLSLKEIAQ